MTWSIFVNDRGEIVRAGLENKTAEVIGTVQKEIHESRNKKWQFLEFFSEQDADWWDNNVKQCTKCGGFKSLDKFHRLSKSQDGHTTICKQCRNPMSAEQQQMHQMYPIGAKEAAKKLGISSGTLHRLDKDGKFKAIHVGNGHLRYNEDMIREFSTNRTRQMPKQPEFENPDNGKHIELTRGLYTLVSPEDYEFLSQFDWMAAPFPKVADKFGAQIPSKHSAEAFGSTQMHQVIWRKSGQPPRRNIYHINNNGLDNRRENLTDKKPKWLVARLDKWREKYTPQLRQRSDEQIPIENPHIGRLLTLGNGLAIALDDGDYDRISKFKWSIIADKTKNKIKIYQQRKGRKHRPIAQEILNLSPGTPITYLNKNPFDNRRSNIHILEIIRKNTDELSAMGIRWNCQSECYVFRFKTHGKEMYFSSENLETVLSFMESSKEQIRTGIFFCQKCQRFIDSNKHNGIVCNECYPQTTAGKGDAAIERVRDNAEKKKALREEKTRIYMEFRDKYGFYK